MVMGGERERGGSVLALPRSHMQVFELCQSLCRRDQEVRNTFRELRSRSWINVSTSDEVRYSFLF